MPSVGVRTKILMGIVPAAVADLKRSYESDSEADWDDISSSYSCGTDSSPHEFTDSGNEEHDGWTSDSAGSTLVDENGGDISEASDDSSAVEGHARGDLGSVFDSMLIIVNRRYLVERVRLPKQRTQLDLILGTYKKDFPKEFRLWVRIEPDVFDSLVTILSGHPVFNNDSYCEQKSVAEQVVIALHRFGVYGCGASVRLIAQHFGVSPGLVDLATRRVMAAVLETLEMINCVAWPSAANRYKAKAQVRAKCGDGDVSKGWLMIDGTHINLYQKPNFFGDRFFDRKSNYSFNVQITAMPSGEIIDYAIGDVGSANDATGLRRTKLYKDQIRGGPRILLEEGEFCWGDSGYPLHKWLVIPFPHDSRLTVNESKFNTRLAKIRVVAEHTIGYLKGRFQSLKELRILITRPSDVKYATLWIRACVHLHMYAFFKERSPDLLTDEWATDAVQWEGAQEDAAAHRAQRDEGRGRYDFTGTGKDQSQTKAERDAELGQGKQFRQHLVKCIARESAQRKRSKAAAV